MKPILHKFRLKLAKRMRADLNTPWRKIWDEERKILMDRLKSESQLLLNQVLLELKDSRSFRGHAVISHSDEKLPHQQHKQSRYKKPYKRRIFCKTYFVVAEWTTSNPKPHNSRRCHIFWHFKNICWAKLGQSVWYNCLARYLLV